MFRFDSPDDPLILAVTLALTERKQCASDAVVGDAAEYVWDWLEDCIYRKSSHPKIYHQWKSYRAVQQALRRLQQRGLLRGTVDPELHSGPLLWRPTRGAGDFRLERRLFAGQD